MLKGNVARKEKRDNVHIWACKEERRTENKEKMKVKSVGRKSCLGNSKRGRDYAYSIHAGEMDACPFFFLNFKGTPSQEEHKTIFSG
jgi:hypothetical protein